jgi:hypothetical protein
MRTTFRSFQEPTVTQFSVFLKNRVGELRDMTTKLAEARIQIYGLSVWDATDHAVVRIVLSDPPWALKTLREAGYAVSKTELIAVGIADAPDGIDSICSALLMAEVNINYAYPLLCRPGGRPVLLLHVDDIGAAVATLARKGFELLHHGNLRDEEPGPPKRE